MLEELKKYFESTSREKILEDWEKSAEFDNVGPTIEEFNKIMERKTIFQSPIGEIAIWDDSWGHVANLLYTKDYLFQDLSEIPSVKVLHTRVLYRDELNGTIPISVNDESVCTALVYVNGEIAAIYSGLKCPDYLTIDVKITINEQELKIETVETEIFNGEIVKL